MQNKMKISCESLRYDMGQYFRETSSITFWSVLIIKVMKKTRKKDGMYSNSLDVA